MNKKDWSYNFFSFFVFLFLLPSFIQSSATTIQGKTVKTLIDFGDQEEKIKTNGQLSQ